MIENIPKVYSLIITIISIINMWIFVIDIIYSFDMMISKIDMELIK